MAARRIDPAHIKVPLPLIQQRDEESCGPASLISIASYFNVEHSGMLKVRQRLRTGTDTGTNPNQIARVARRLGLRVSLRTHLGLDGLRKELDRRRPVICAVQVPDTDGSDGHYITAMGYDRKHIYAMDSRIDGYVGYMSNTEFVARWTDTCAQGKLWEQLGIVIWKDRPPYLKMAMPIIWTP
jgi:ABC-type bacteriocin/lantibiotic exporter with double-glycine peptidase domain